MSTQSTRFIDLVTGLVKQFEECVEPAEWVTKRYSKKMRDEDGKTFVIPALFLRRGPTRVLLDPIAYDVPGSEAVVDLYLMPTDYDSAALCFEKGNWVIYNASTTDSTVRHSVTETAGLPFSEVMINEILDSISEPVSPSFLIDTGGVGAAT